MPRPAGEAPPLLYLCLWRAGTHSTARDAHPAERPPPTFTYAQNVPCCPWLCRQGSKDLPQAPLALLTSSLRVSGLLNEWPSKQVARALSSASKRTGNRVLLPLKCDPARGPAGERPGIPWVPDRVTSDPHGRGAGEGDPCRHLVWSLWLLWLSSGSGGGEPHHNSKIEGGCLPCRTCQCLSPATTTITTHCPGESLSLSRGRHPPGDCQVTVASEPRPPLSFSGCVKGCACVYEWPCVNECVSVYMCMLFPLLA